MHLHPAVLGALCLAFVVSGCAVGRQDRLDRTDDVRAAESARVQPPRAHGHTAPSAMNGGLEREEYAVRWGVESNFLGQGRFRSVLTLENRAGRTLGSDGWALYFNSLRAIDEESLPRGIRLTHIDGDFYRLEPTADFEPLPAGAERAIPMEGSWPAIKVSDAPDGFYFVFGDRIVPVAATSVEPFVAREQLHRGPGDAVPVPTPGSVYADNASLRLLSPEQVGRIVPAPNALEPGRGSFTVTASVPIHYEEGLESEAGYLAEALARKLGTAPAVRRGVPAGRSAVVLRRGGPGDTDAPGAYRLVIHDEGIEITGGDAAGVFHGIQSLRALIPLEVWSRPAAAFDLDAVRVTDAPRFDYRGLHLDVSRNFQPLESVRRLLEVMAFYKLNRFHFHLTDDEGWRLAIDGLPELTEVGGRRGHTLDERGHLIPSYGSGADPDALPGSGWYSREQFIELLRFARDRHIEVIPEIDVPGHARAAIVAMRSRHDRLMEQGDPEGAARYRLDEPGDTSRYRSIQRWAGNVINVCQESTYRFLEKVFDEIQAMYREAGAPLTTIHVGGDEVPRGAWEGSPACHRLLAEEGFPDTIADLPDHFFRRVVRLLEDRGLVMGGWEEIALGQGHGAGREPKPEFVGRARPNVWSNVWGSGTEDYAYRLANAGYEVIMSHASNFYFDMAYTKDPLEPGFYWAAFIDTPDAFGFVPFDLYQNAVVDALGRPIAESAFDGAERLTDAGRRNILGLQGQLWSETIRTPERMEYMALPRLLALAERAWVGQPAWAALEDRSARDQQRAEAWNEFANRLGQRELARLDRMLDGMGYRLPPPGAEVEAGVLRANVAYPGLVVRYTTDGSTPTPDAPAYAEPVAVEPDAVIKLRTFDTRGRGSRTVTVGARAASR